MGKNISKNKYNAHSEKEISFRSNVLRRYNSYPDCDVESQIDALKIIIEYVKYRKKLGKSLLDIRDEVLTYVSTVVEMIHESDLINFYKLRTYEYMQGMDFTPYLEEIINKKINLKKYERDNLSSISPNIENNIMVLLCGFILDIGAEKDRIKNEELIGLCEKIENNSLEISDLKTLKKYVDMCFKGYTIGKMETWEKARKNPEDLRKKLYKHLDEIFDVRDFNQEHKENNISNSDMSEEEIANKLLSINAGASSEKNLSMKIASISEDNSYFQNARDVKYKNLLMNPFISNNEDNNFLIFMSDAFDGLREITNNDEFSKICEILYNYAITSEKSDKAYARDTAKKRIYKWFDSISYGESSIHIKERLAKRIAILIDFFRANGDMDTFCSLNNERLTKLKLEELTIEPDDFYKKFTTKNKNFFDLLFPDIDMSTDQYYRECYKGTPLAETSTEAVIGMSAFYVNRLAKFAPKYARLRYILDYKNAIERIYENPDLEYEDLGYSDESIRWYMSLYDELQTRILQQYFKKVPEGTVLYEEKELKHIKKILNDIKPIYTEIMSDENFDFERDILNIMLDARLIDNIYQLKEFSTKSLIYSAMTDRSKNMINWGYVLNDEERHSNLALIGFDIKSLNMPIYVHMKKDDLIKFLKEINGNAIIPVYCGNNDMYNYVLRQRVTTQIVYPLSKDEKNKKLLKVTDNMIFDPFYRHIRWLQQPNKPPYVSYVPGSKLCNIESGEVFSAPNKQDKKSTVPKRWQK